MAVAGQTPTRGEERSRGEPERVLPLAVLVGAAYSIGLAAAGFFDNEGRYAEVARQMVIRGDWVTPYLNDVPILTKPPLTQWLTALVFLVAGPTEWARLVAVVASIMTLIATCRLGALLYDRTVGLVSGMLLATMIGFALEARTLRPDAILVACTTWAIWCWCRAESEPETSRTPWLVGFWAALGIGMLAKGFVPFVVVGFPIGLAMLHRYSLAEAVTRLRPGIGVVTLAAIVLPWHVAAALRNPGFAWDYVVNQHILFAFDTKEPRDSEGDSLAFFWLALLFRTAPWGFVAPFAIGTKLPRRASPAHPSTTPILWGWVLGHAALFSLTPSRLEHYTLPAHPAVALLAAQPIVAFVRGEAGRPARMAIATLAGTMAVVGAGLLLHGRAALSGEYWIPQAPEMLTLVPWAAAVLLVGGVGALMAVAGGARRSAVACLVGATTLLGGITARALVMATPLFSWKPVAEAIRAAGRDDAVIVFEAPVEYQLVGGLDYYLGRSVTLLEPSVGFIPPTYLEGRTDGMFLSRRHFAERWASSEAMLLVSDPQMRRDDPTGIVPGTFTPIAHFGDRWILANAAAE